jgi:hypothetical protein
MDNVREMFDENVDYCEYVYNKNLEYDLQLDRQDIIAIAQEYAEELMEKDIDVESEVVENDALLLEVVREYMKDNAPKEEDDLYPDHEEAPEIDKKKQDLYLSNPHAYSDDYDDHALDDGYNKYSL